MASSSHDGILLAMRLASSAKARAVRDRGMSVDTYTHAGSQAAHMAVRARAPIRGAASEDEFRRYRPLHSPPPAAAVVDREEGVPNGAPPAADTII